MKMSILILLNLTFLLASFSSSASVADSMDSKSYLIYNASPGLKSRLVQSYGAQDVFTSGEKNILKGAKVTSNVLKMSLDERQYALVKKLLVSEKEALIESNPSQITLRATQSGSSAPEPYESLQWALKNTGELARQWVSDIDVRKVQGIPGEDLGVDKESLKENPKRKVKVAIVDSGVDIEHPDLVDQILKKEGECQALEAYNACLASSSEPKSCHEEFSKQDNDGNGYPMDCAGWNISAKEIPGADVPGGPKVSDTDGHGTHVAGIIGAKRNGEGIAGVIQNVKLIPVKVSVSSSSSNSQEAPTDKIAKGILYAIQSGAEVINLSLGWRFDQDSLLMRQMIEHAASKGILIVAAAGNDAHDGPVYPCSYDSVVCVASHNVDGKLSTFSNYGAHVDIAAPGDKILSSWPGNKRARSFTQEEAYEYLSGTSQAAPQVTGILARLLNANYTPTQALQRLLSGARPFAEADRAFIKTGKADLAGSLKIEAQSDIYPINKAPALVKWDEAAESRSFVLKFKNIGDLKGSAKVRIEHANSKQALNQSLKLITKSIDISDIAPGEIVSERIYFSAPYDGAGEFYFKIFIEQNSSERSYFVKANAVSIVDGENQKGNQRDYTIINPQRLEDVSINKFDNIVSAKGTDFLASKSVNGNTFLSLLSQSDDGYVQSQWRKIPIKEAVFLNLSKVDIDLDKQADYVITLVEIGDLKRTTKFFVYDQNFTEKKVLIAPENTFNNELVVLPGGFKWARAKKRMVPAWIGVGKRPLAQRESPGPWENEAPELKINRMFLLTPKGLETVSFPGEEEMPLHILYQSKQGKAAGALTLISGDNFGYKKKYTAYRFDGKLTKTKQFELSPYVDLLNARPLPMAKASGDNAFFAQTNSLGARVVGVSLDEEGLEINQVYIPTPEGDSPNQQSDIARVLSFDGESAIFQDNYRLRSNQSKMSIPSKVSASRIRHEILTSKSALYLRSALSPGLTGELVSLDKTGALTREAKWFGLGINGCSEIGIGVEGEQEFLFYACPELAKIIKFNLSM